ncbi:MAG: GTP pyrophosphokinase [Ruminococcaceae bacterium]|nr:GTP pyrophosphokinase [Oscillospiraceae bacterium]
MLYSEKIKLAMNLSFGAHKNQLDKSGYPYFAHPLHLAEQMKDETTVIVALLHDVVEDTEMSLKDISDLGFETEITQALSLLTHDSNVPYMDYIKEIKKDPIATAVKIADLKHNSDLSRLDTVTDRDIERAQKYKQALYELENKA